MPYEGKQRLIELGGRLHWCNRPTQRELQERARKDDEREAVARRRSSRTDPLHVPESRIPADQELHKKISETQGKSKMCPPEPW